MMKIATTDKKNSNLINNSNNFKIGNSKENNSELPFNPKQDKLINGKLELVDFNNKLLEVDNLNITMNS